MTDLHVRTERVVEPAKPLFSRVLGPDFEALPKAIRVTHQTVDLSHWRGRASVQRGRSLWSRFLAGLFGFPPESADVDVEVTKTVTSKGETWQRRFGALVFRSHLSETKQGMTESFGLFTFRLGLKVEDGALQYPIASGRLGPLPLPRGLFPVSISTESVIGERFCFDVKILAPLTKELLVHYRGWLVEAELASMPDK